MSQHAKRHVSRAKHIQRTLGTRVAAGYLRNQGVLIEEALDILVAR
jgi:hypothetical protein